MGAVNRSPMCPQAALTVAELAKLEPRTVLVQFDYQRITPTHYSLNNIHRMLYLGWVPGKPGQVRLQLLDVDYSVPQTYLPWNVGLMPDPVYNQRFPLSYVPGTKWHNRAVLVLPQNIAKPRPTVSF